MKYRWDGVAAWNGDIFAASHTDEFRENASESLKILQTKHPVSLDVWADDGWAHTGHIKVWFDPDVKRHPPKRNLIDQPTGERWLFISPKDVWAEFVYPLTVHVAEWYSFRRNPLVLDSCRKAMADAFRAEGRRLRRGWLNY